MTKYDINERTENKRTKMNLNRKQRRKNNRLCNLKNNKTRGISLEFGAVYLFDNSQRIMLLKKPKNKTLPKKIKDQAKKIKELMD